ncbi:PEP-CTERM sorting domain-containing protein [Leptothermofonsia sichuanensis E412]|uniref:PEP-CTERM sorting domain-containing protein n=1 Tax=Leptothermofonsia sichuanensis TaxID=2917832 RepID=UPI001CA683E6|nr:PEP-CTERM sorting domain-containing protein [Leptothermofonsia sichuanensis]QZZ22304.1 PEP-CTERM sorting domain-containing protein [Leptothermofonsia sichuanensis E412]
MKFNQVPAILGLATAAIAPAIIVHSAPASAATFRLFSGVTSVFLDLPTLETVGLSLTGASDTVDPVSSDFLVGFPITPATTFTFSFDSGSGFAPVSGTIEHSGSVTFNNALTLGNFSIGFDPARAVGDASGFFVRDTITLGAILFDLATPSSLTFADDNLAVQGNLLVSPELAGVLGNSGLAGATIGVASVNGEAVPEPATIMGVLAAGGFLAASRRRALKK